MQVLIELLVIIESNLHEANEAVDAGADVVMLDNMVGQALFSTASTLKQTKKPFLIEASGGITEDNCSEYFHQGTLQYLPR